MKPSGDHLGVCRTPTKEERLQSCAITASLCAPFYDMPPTDARRLYNAERAARRQD
jgi:hypothetical protein